MSLAERMLSDFNQRMKLSELILLERRFVEFTTISVLPHEEVVGDLRSKEIRTLYACYVTAQKKALEFKVTFETKHHRAMLSKEAEDAGIELQLAKNEADWLYYMLRDCLYRQFPVLIRSECWDVRLGKLVVWKTRLGDSTSPRNPYQLFPRI